MREWSLTLTVEGERKWMNLNDRTHYRPKAAMTKLWRTAAYDAAVAANIPTLARATITGYIYKNRAGRYDPHNLFPTLKAVIDGIVDAGVLEDDDHTHLRAAIEHGGIDRTMPPHIVITIREDTPKLKHVTTLRHGCDEVFGCYYQSICLLCGWSWWGRSEKQAEAKRTEHERTHLEPHDHS